MTPIVLALMLSHALPLAPLMLALAACGGGQGESRQHDGSSAPLGLELAMAGMAQDASAPLPLPLPAPLVTLSAEELATRIKAGDVRLIDVRTDAEVAAGAIPGAEHIPLDSFDPAQLDLTDGRAVVLYCRSGRRSQIAGEKLAAFLGEPVAHLEGGILAWEAAGEPVEKR